MKNKVNLDNGYFLEITGTVNENATDIKKLKLNDIKKKGVLVLNIDFNTFNKQSYKKILKRLLFVKSEIIRNRLELGILQDSKRLIGWLINYNKDNNQHNEFLSGINAIFFSNYYEMYNYIYDTACNYLDDYFYGKNYCDFNNNVCGAKSECEVGCCRHFKYHKLGCIGFLLSNKLVVCEYLKNKKCSVKCLPCKLFTCSYLNKKGIKFKIKEILLLDTFFNPIQKYIIKTKVFTPKEKILKKLCFLLKKPGGIKK